MKKAMFFFLMLVLASSFVLSADIAEEKLMDAIRRQDLSGVKDALSNGANPSYVQGEDSALMIACSKQNLEIVKLLLQEGANASEKNANGQTALMIAARDCNNLAILRLLINAGHANVNDQDNGGVTVFMYAMKSSDINVLKFMLERNITNINASDNTGTTAAMWAAKLNKPQAIKLLAKNAMGVDWTTTNNDGDNVLSLAITNGGLDMVKALLKEVKDFDIDMKMGNGEPTLFWAMRTNKSAQIIEYLMDSYDVDILLETTDDKGRDIETFVNKQVKANKKMILRKIKEAKQGSES